MRFRMSFPHMSVFQTFSILARSVLPHWVILQEAWGFFKPLCHVCIQSVKQMSSEQSVIPDLFFGFHGHYHWSLWESYASDNLSPLPALSSFSIFKMNDVGSRDSTPGFKVFALHAADWFIFQCHLVPLYRCKRRLRAPQVWPKPYIKIKKWKRRWVMKDQVVAQQ